MRCALGRFGTLYRNENADAKALPALLIQESPGVLLSVLPARLLRRQDSRIGGREDSEAKGSEARGTPPNGCLLL
ncbi:hypothetical protein CF326_g9396, partial [Tilletia indica]